MKGLLFSVAVVIWVAWGSNLSAQDFIDPGAEGWAEPSSSSYEPVPYEPVPYEPAYEPSPYEAVPYEYEPVPYEPAPYEPAYEPSPYEAVPYEPAPYEPIPVESPPAQAPADPVAGGYVEPASPSYEPEPAPAPSDLAVSQGKPAPFSKDAPQIFTGASTTGRFWTDLSGNVVDNDAPIPELTRSPGDDAAARRLAESMNTVDDLLNTSGNLSNSPGKMWVSQPQKVPLGTPGTPGQWQVPKTYDGSGIGLSDYMVKIILESFNGRLFMRSISLIRKPAAASNPLPPGGYVPPYVPPYVLEAVNPPAPIVVEPPPPEDTGETING